MIAVLQRVTCAQVMVADTLAASIAQGLLVFVAVQAEDDYPLTQRFVERILNYRLFSDSLDKMNLSLRDIRGGLLLVPQFTLAANTKKGRRPSFAGGASEEQGARIFHYLVEIAHNRHAPVESGVFGANMQVQLTNDGPVTLILD